MLRSSDELIGEGDEALSYRLRADEAHWPLLDGFTEESLTRPQDDWEDKQPQFIDKVVLNQGAPKLIAGVDHQVSIQVLLQFRDLVNHVVLENRSVAPYRLFKSGGHDVFRQAVQSVRPVAGSGVPS